MKLLFRLVCAVLLLTLFILPLGGCPSAIDPDAVRDGSSFRMQITNEFYSKYDVGFSEENLPVVSVSYQTEDGTGKTATF